MATLYFEDGAIRAGFATTIMTAVPKGTGDLFGALLLGQMMKKRTTTADAFKRAFAGVRLVVRKSAGRPELLLVPNLRAIASANLYSVDATP